MDIPIGYVIINIMIMLKENNRPLSISRKTLVSYLKKLIRLLNLDREDLEELIFKFNFKNDLYEFLSDYEEYFSMSEGYIVLEDNVSIETLRTLVSETIYGYDDDFIMDINDILYGDYSFYEMLGIRVNEELFDFLLDIERDIEKEYIKLSYMNASNDKDKYLMDRSYDKIRTLKTLINTMYINIDLNYSVADQKKFVAYARSFASSVSRTSVNMGDDDIDNTMDLALFINRDIFMNTLADRLFVNLLRRLKYFDMKDMTILNFYLAYLENLNNEIMKIKNSEVKVEFILTRYRLMYALDSIYDLRSIIKDEKPNDLVSDYEFMIARINFYIEEILSTSDSKYRSNGEADVVTYYNNIIKKLYIETYFKLTNDMTIIDRIKGNENYNVNKISTRIFDSFIPLIEEEKKVKKKSYI